MTEDYVRKSLFGQIWIIFIQILSLVLEFFNLQGASKLFCGRTADAHLLPATLYAIILL